MFLDHQRKQIAGDLGRGTRRLLDGSVLNDEADETTRAVPASRASACGGHVFLIVWWK
jgi:hypothetical protein